MQGLCGMYGNLWLVLNGVYGMALWIVWYALRRLVYCTYLQTSKNGQKKTSLPILITQLVYANRVNRDSH